MTVSYLFKNNKVIYVNIHILITAQIFAKHYLMKDFNYGATSKQNLNNIFQSQKKTIRTMIGLKQKNVLKLCLKLRLSYSGN